MRWHFDFKHGLFVQNHCQGVILLVNNIIDNQEMV